MKKELFTILFCAFHTNAMDAILIPKVDLAFTKQLSTQASLLGGVDFLNRTNTWGILLETEVGGLYSFPEKNEVYPYWGLRFKLNRNLCGENKYKDLRWGAYLGYFWVGEGGADFFNGAIYFYKNYDWLFPSISIGYQTKLSQFSKGDRFVKLSVNLNFLSNLYGPSSSNLKTKYSLICS